MSASIDRARVETIFFVLVPLGASIGLCGSWLAFVSGPRRGRSQRWITAVGVSACVSGLIPSAAPAAIRAGFPSRQFSVEPVALTDDDVFLFHHVIRSASSTTDDEVALVRIDLRTREVRVDDATLAVTRVSGARHMSPWIFRGLEPVIGDTDDPDSSMAATGSKPVAVGHPMPADFGRADVTNRFSVDCIGAGHRLNVYGANSKHQYFRDRAGAHCFALEELDALASDLAIEDAVVTTTDTWLVRDDRRAWWWLDVRTGEHEPCDALARDSITGWSFGPSTVDGKLLVADEDGLQVLDANTHERRLVEGGERVHGMCRVLDDQACSLPANDAAVWLNVYVGDTVDDRKQAAFLIDIANARIVDRVIFEDPYARLLAANDDGVLYQSARSGDVKWFDCATRELRTLIVAVP
jgi:hypothetical protein